MLSEKCDGNRSISTSAAKKGSIRQLDTSIFFMRNGSPFHISLAGECEASSCALVRSVVKFFATQKVESVWRFKFSNYYTDLRSQFQF